MRFYRGGREGVESLNSFNFFNGGDKCLFLLCYTGWPFYVGVAAAAGHLAWQVSSVNTQSRVDCNAKYVLQFYVPSPSYPS